MPPTKRLPWILFSLVLKNKSLYGGERLSHVSSKMSFCETFFKKYYFLKSKSFAGDQSDCRRESFQQRHFWKTFSCNSVLQQRTESLILISWIKFTFVLYSNRKAPLQVFFCDFCETFQYNCEQESTCARASFITKLQA